MPKFPIYAVIWSYDQSSAIEGPGIPYLRWSKEEALQEMNDQALMCPSHCHVACYEYTGRGDYPGHPSQAWYTDTIRRHNNEDPHHLVFS